MTRDLSRLDITERVLDDRIWVGESAHGAAVIGTDTGDDTEVRCYDYRAKR